MNNNRRTVKKVLRVIHECIEIASLVLFLCIMAQMSWTIVMLATMGA